jgi:putative endonuclease
VHKLSFKSLFLILIFLLIPIVFLLRLNQKPSTVLADWPPARRTSGSESTTTTYFFFGSTFYVYLLKSLKDSKYYIGQTNDIQKRLVLHNSGMVISTKSRKPFILVGYETYLTRSESMWREHQLKNHSDQKKKFISKLFTENG